MQIKNAIRRAIVHRHGVITFTARGSRSIPFGNPQSEIRNRKSLDVDFTHATPLDKIQIHAHGFEHAGNPVLPRTFTL